MSAERDSRAERHGLKPVCRLERTRYTARRCRSSPEASSVPNETRHFAVLSHKNGAATFVVTPPMGQPWLFTAYWVVAAPVALVFMRSRLSVR